MTQTDRFLIGRSTIRRMESPNPPLCDFCDQPAVTALQYPAKRETWIRVYCEACWQKRRPTIFSSGEAPSKQEAANE